MQQENIFISIFAGGNTRLVSWLTQKFANPGAMKQQIFISWNGEKGFPCQLFLQKHVLESVQGGREVPDIILREKNAPRRLPTSVLMGCPGGLLTGALPDEVAVQLSTAHIFCKCCCSIGKGKTTRKASCEYMNTLLINEC